MLLELHSKEGVEGLNGSKPDMNLQVVSVLFVNTNRIDKDDKLSDFDKRHRLDWAYVKLSGEMVTVHFFNSLLSWECFFYKIQHYQH